MAIWRFNSTNELLKRMEKEIEKTRADMHERYDKFSLMSTEVIEISQQLDELLNKYNQEKSRLQKQST
ncbi:hypothetical protein J6TS7_20930 [Paenibacillus dendritiformis]|uniref:aspartyl-phosphate phosphatase Spo0E family protein n=1 Tax=Paenibacillus TaxID=44249 RepID=UPI001B079DD8|nr:aspartyl-phosphate phosphatase Spo0E family protein [Paenibacillus dendritiformis]GIO78483.1 hypothetical protein J6TS7_20930 [Paenibacillus dendritiformis]